MTAHDDLEMPSPKNVIFCADARRMAEVPDESAQLVVTSPPYNVGISYDNHNDDLPLDDYLTFFEPSLARVLSRFDPWRKALHQCRQHESQTVSATQCIDHR